VIAEIEAPDAQHNLAQAVRPGIMYASQSGAPEARHIASRCASTQELGSDTALWQDFATLC